MNPSEHLWLWSDRYKQPVRVEQRLGLWEDEAIRIWLPQEDAIVRVRPSDVRNLESQREILPELNPVILLRVN